MIEIALIALRLRWLEIAQRFWAVKNNGTNRPIEIRVLKEIAHLGRGISYRNALVLLGGPRANKYHTRTRPFL